MKKWLLIPAMLLVILLGGCIPTVAQIEKVSSKTDSLMVVVSSVQETIKDMVDKGVIKSEKVDTLLVEMDEAKEDIVKVNEAIRGKLDEGALESAKAGWEASKEFNPYYIYGLIAINILEAVGIWNEKKKVTGLKKGVSRATGESDPEVAKRIYDTIKSEAKGLLGQSAM